MLLNEFNIDIAKEVWQEESWAEGKAEGKAEGIAEGKAEGKAESANEIAKKLLASGVSLNIISDSTGLQPAEIVSLRDGK